MVAVLLPACSSSDPDALPETSTTAASQPSSSAPTTGVDPLAVYACDGPELGLGDAGSALAGIGFDKCALPFGILIAADTPYSRPHIVTAATVLAELLDRDRDGEPDDSAVAEALQDWSGTAWLAMPTDPDAWEREQLPALEPYLGYDIIIPSWWTGSTKGKPDERSKAVIVEEVVHFVNQFGWSTAHPEALGVEGWDSIIARETERAQCVWWQHPENDCPDRPAESPGDCSGPSCDVVEFYQQVLVTRAGMEPGWVGIGFPEDRESLEALLSDEIKQMMDDPRYHQPSTPLTFAYP
jgi:hypothetical protein